MVPRLHACGYGCMHMLGSTIGPMLTPEALLIVCSVSPQHVVCYHDSFVHLTAGVVTQVAKLCLCTSGHELLVGKESISSSYSPPFHPTYKHHQTQVQKMDLSNLLNQ